MHILKQVEISIGFLELNKSRSVHLSFRSVNILENKSNRRATQNKQKDCTNFSQKTNPASSYSVLIIVKNKTVSVTLMCYNSVQLKTIAYFAATTNHKSSALEGQDFEDKRSILDGNKYSYRHEDSKTRLDIKRLLREFCVCFTNQSQNLVNNLLKHGLFPIWLSGFIDMALCRRVVTGER